MRVLLPEGSACQSFCHGAIEEDVTSFLLTHATEGVTFIVEIRHCGSPTVGSYRGMNTIAC
jgi:hypothetical protein